MKINKINYEEYVVSSLEGMLTTEEQALLDAFLHRHPELKKEADVYKRVFLVPDNTIIYPHKLVLLKPEAGDAAAPVYKRRFAKINRINYEEYLVSSLEGKLTTEEQASLDAYLHEHPELIAEVDAYKQAYLVPDKTIKYPHKSLLLRSEPARAVTPFYKRYSVWLSVAATILLLIAFRTFLFIDNYSGRTTAPMIQSQSAQQGYALTGKFDLPGRLVQENFMSPLGKSKNYQIAGNQNNSVEAVNRQDNEPTSDVAIIPARVSYLPQAPIKLRITSLPMTNAAPIVAVAQREQVQRTQSALISNAAQVGKTLWHLSGRQLPSESQYGQPQVVQINYNSKDFSFVKIIH